MCCHTESQFLQLENEFLTSATHFNAENLFSSDLLLTSSEVAFPFRKSDFNLSFNYTSPPPRCTSSRLALQQVYRL
jgi:hypothetical protein